MQRSFEQTLDDVEFAFEEDVFVLVWIWIA